MRRPWRPCRPPGLVLYAPGRPGSTPAVGPLSRRHAPAPVRTHRGSAGPGRAVKRSSPSPGQQRPLGLQFMRPARPAAPGVGRSATTERPPDRRHRGVRGPASDAKRLLPGSRGTRAVARAPARRRPRPGPSGKSTRPAGTAGTRPDPQPEPPGAAVMSYRPSSYRSTRRSTAAQPTSYSADTPSMPVPAPCGSRSRRTAAARVPPADRRPAAGSGPRRCAAAAAAPGTARCRAETAGWSRSWFRHYAGLPWPGTAARDARARPAGGRPRRTAGAARAARCRARCCSRRGSPR